MSDTKRIVVPTHVHSDLSLGDSISRISSLVRRAKELGMPALAITDHGTMAGVLEFQKECAKTEYKRKVNGVDETFNLPAIKPIFGMECYVALQSAKEPKSLLNPTSHLILLARNAEGYKNLCQLLAWSHRYGFSHKPRIDLEVLQQHSAGLIGQASCVGGLAQRYILGWSAYDHEKKERVRVEPQPDLVVPMLGKLADIFGKDHFYLEVQNHERKDPEVLSKVQREDYDWLMSAQDRVTRAFLGLGKQLDLPVVITNDSHYTFPDQADARKIVLAVGDKKVFSEKFTGELGDPELLTSQDGDEDAREVTGQMYLKSADEMLLAAKGHQFLLDNTLRIAEMCDVKIEPPRSADGKALLNIPSIEVNGKTSGVLLRDWAEEGFALRYPGNPPAARARLEYELQVMHDLGFDEYHLIVADLMKWAQSKGIRVGTGRGSAAGSIVVYCLGITDLDPLRHGLFFERYLSAEKTPDGKFRPLRTSPPDIDMDFDPMRVEEVIAYCNEKYGNDHVAYIATYQSIQARGSIHKVGRAFGLNQEWREKLASAIPEGQGGEFRVKLEDALEEPATKAVFEAFVKRGGELAERMIRICIQLDDVKIYRSEHAAGILISGTPLRDVVPLASYDRENPDRLTTEIPHVFLEEVGLLKMDMLAIDGLTIVERAVKFIREREPQFDLPLEKDETYSDKASYGILKRGETHGVWQLSSGEIRKVCMESQPGTLQEIAAILALYRPGPLDYVDPALGLNMVEVYIQRKDGRLPIVYDHPCLEKILAPTYGVLVFQEQVMALLGALCGWDMTQADEARAAIGKKKKEKLVKLKPKFLEDAVKHSGCAPELAQKIWDTLETFSRYSFNSAHATAYGKLSYVMAYLKAHYPVEFLAACLARVVEKGDKKVRAGLTQAFVFEANRRKIPVLPPDIVLSGIETKPEGNSIRLGFNLVAGIAEASAAKILSAGVTPEDTIGQAVLKLASAGVGPAQMRLLTKAGAFSRYGARKDVIEAIDKYAKTKTSKKRMAEFFGLAPTMTLAPSEEVQRDVLTSTQETMDLAVNMELIPPRKKITLKLESVKDLEINLPDGKTKITAWLKTEDGQWIEFLLGEFCVTEHDKLPGEVIGVV